MRRVGGIHSCAIWAVLLVHNSGLGSSQEFPYTKSFHDIEDSIAQKLDSTVKSENVQDLQPAICLQHTPGCNWYSSPV